MKPVILKLWDDFHNRFFFDFFNNAVRCHVIIIYFNITKISNKLFSKYSYRSHTYFTSQSIVYTQEYIHEALEEGFTIISWVSFDFTVQSRIVSGDHFMPKYIKLFFFDLRVLISSTKWDYRSWFKMWNMLNKIFS